MVSLSHWVGHGHRKVCLHRLSWEVVEVVGDAKVMMDSLLINYS